jgi:hypothetical protein
MPSIAAARTKNPRMIAASRPKPKRLGEEEIEDVPFAEDGLLLAGRQVLEAGEARHPVHELGHVALGRIGLLLESPPPHHLREHRQEEARGVGLDAQESRFQIGPGRTRGRWRERATWRAVRDPIEGAVFSRSAVPALTVALWLLAAACGELELADGPKGLPALLQAADPPSIRPTSHEDHVLILRASRSFTTRRA